MKSNLTGVSLALLSAAFLLGCQESLTGPTSVEVTAVAASRAIVPPNCIVVIKGWKIISDACFHDGEPPPEITFP